MSDSPPRQFDPLVIAAVVVILAGMKAASALIVPFLLAVFIAIVASPLLIGLERRRWPSLLAITLVMLLITLVLALFATLVASSLDQFSKDLPAYLEQLRELSGRLAQWLAPRIGVQNTLDALKGAMNPGAAMEFVTTLLGGLGAALTNGVMILITVLFILLEISTFPTKLRAIPGDHQRRTRAVRAFLDSVQHYMAIKTVISLITGVLAGIGTWLIGLDYPLLWGTLAFVLNYVPTIGSAIAAVPAVLQALLQLDWLAAVFTAALYGAINMVMGNIIEPRVMGRGVGLSPLVVFTALVFWGWLLGPVGMLLAVPLTMVVKLGLETHPETRWLSLVLGTGDQAENREAENREADSASER